MSRAAAVEFNTRPFEFAHGRAPRGYGSWAFSHKRNADSLDPEMIWTPYAMSYGDAKRYARSIAQQRGYTELYVMS